MKPNILVTILFVVVISASVLITGFYFSQMNKSSVKLPPTTGTTSTTPGLVPVSTGSVGKDLVAQKNIKKFASYDELKDFLDKNTSTNMGGGFGGGIMMKGMAVDAGVSAPMEAQTAQSVGVGMGGGGADFSKTNIQIEGVDEADIIKTDGDYIYAVAQNSVFIISARPTEEAKILSTIQMKQNINPQNIYINKNSLVIYGSEYNKQIISEEPATSSTEPSVGVPESLERVAKPSMIMPRPYNNYAFFKVFDITDKKNPKKVRDLDFEGNVINSRMIGDYVYFVTTKYGYYNDPMPLPIIMEGDKVLSNDKSVARCNCPDVYYFDIPYSSYNFTSVSAINVSKNDQAIKNEVYLLDGNQNMFVSQDNIYIVYTRYFDERALVLDITKEMILPRLSVKEQEIIKKIEETSDDVLSKEEKRSKISAIIERYIYSLPQKEQDQLAKDMAEKVKQKFSDITKELEKTIIHKISIDNGEIKYKTAGEVTGSVLNQFSMDENNGYFRIATTKNQSWSQFLRDNENGDKARQSYSNLYILDGDLKLAGKVENLATGERIYSVRFMQDRAYMVTFKQTDPLFVIDVKDPRNPSILGELKIPGFSSYLHPYDNNTLIGIGKDTKVNEYGAVIPLGLKISLFDVTDVKNPKESASYILGDKGSDSAALYDHKAFLFSKEKNLLVLPVTEYKENYQQGFIGAAVFNITKDKVDLKGKISHTSANKMNQYDYEAAIQRSLYIDDALYTFSSKYIKINKLADLGLLKNIPLVIGSDQDFNIIN